MSSSEIHRITTEDTSDASEISPPPRPSLPRFGRRQDTPSGRRVHHESDGQSDILRALSRFSARAILEQDISTAAAREPQSLDGAIAQIYKELHEEEEAKKPFHETEAAATWLAFDEKYGEKDEPIHVTDITEEHIDSAIEYISHRYEKEAEEKIVHDPDEEIEKIKIRKKPGFT